MHTLSCPYPRLSLLPGQSQVGVKLSLSPDQGNHCDHQVVGRLLLRVAEFGLESGGEELPYGAGTRNFKVRDLNINLTSSVKDLMSWSEKVAKEEEAMKVLVHDVSIGWWKMII